MLAKVLKWARKTSSIIIVVIGIFIISLFLFLGPLSEFIIEKYDEDWTGRQIEMDKMRVNLFTGGIHIYGLALFEPSKQDTFAYVGHIYSNLEWTHFLRGEYDILEVALFKPDVHIVQGGFTFNFDDLIKRFTAEGDTTNTEKSPEPIHYHIQGIHIDSARIRYQEKNIGSNITLTNLNVKCPSIAWDNPGHHYEASTDFFTGGRMQSVLDIDINSLLYTLSSDIKKVNIAPFLPYLQDVMRVNQLEGLASILFELKGDLNKPAAISLRADNTLSKFSIADFEDNLLTSVQTLTFGIDSINTENEIYNWGALFVDRPYLKFELYLDGDNFTRLMNDTTSTAVSRDSITSEVDYGNPFRVLVGYAIDIMNEYVMKEYSADSIAVTHGQVIYNDYTLNDKFSMDMDSLFLSSGRLNSQNSSLNFVINSRVNKTGYMKAVLSMDPHNLENLEMVYTLRDVRMSSFSPYSVYYVAHPFWDGLIYYDNKTKVLNHIITSENKLEIKRIEVGKKVKNTTAFDLPLRLAVAILRDQHGNVNLDVPVEGNLDDPKYRLGKVIWGIVKNILVKAATSPYKLLANAIKADEDDLKAIQFEYLSDSLTKKQQKNLSTLARVLKLKPELKINLVYLPGYPDEKEMMAAYEAKKRYILKIDSTRDDEPTPAQIKQIEALSINDSSFVDYLNRSLLFEGSLPPLEKCKRLVGNRRLNNRMNALISNRKKLLSDYLSGNERVQPNAFALEDAEEKAFSDGVPKFEVRFGLIDE
ncbi:MAG TPA: DUF748 domain-containing protein [Cyclobacteriaceae bacterium]|nr:DUF748 domain-containing protein [Cyclobacteriaceae bacterium]